MKPTYELINGIKCYAPEHSLKNEHYPEEMFDQLVQIEDQHFWFQIRNRCISSLLNRYGSTDSSRRFLELGCGTGVVLKHLSKTTKLRLSGAEIHIAGLLHARKRLPDVEFFQVDALQMPFKGEFDYVGMFDVLEHIEADVSVIQNVAKVLLPGGLFFISVPQYSWMWSRADDEAFHKRRYSRSELTNKLEKNGFKILYSGSYLFTLFPLMLLSRLTGKNKRDNATELQIHPLINRIFYFLSRIDLLLIRSGIRLLFGGSILCVAQKE